MMCTRYNYGKKNTKRSNRKNENKDRIRRYKEKNTKTIRKANNHGNLVNNRERMKKNQNLFYYTLSLV